MSDGDKAPTTGPLSGDSNELNESSYMLRNKIRFDDDEEPLHHGGHRITALPDDDWGWYVVAGCAFANFLLPGMLRSFGPEVLDQFVEMHDFEFGSRFVTRWIPATFDLMFFIAGSFSCLLCELTSHRAVTFWGGLLASIGMMSSSFANSIPHLYISHGLMVGIGAGLCYPAGILMVNEYFNVHRGLANGLSLVGTTVGSLALPPYIKFLTSSYGYKGGILIVSGMMLNVLACALTYKPLDDEYVKIVSPTSPLSTSLTSVNTRVTVADQYYTAVVESPSPKSVTAVEVAAAEVALETVDDDEDVSNPNDFARIAYRRLFGGGVPTTEFLAVSAVNAVGHLAYATFTATVAAFPLPHVFTLRLAGADAAGRVLAPVVSDLVSPSGSGSTTSVYLYAAAMAISGAALLAAAVSNSSNRPTTVPSFHCLFIAFGLASGAAISLEPLIAVSVLGRKRLSTSYSATLLGKGAVQLVVDLLFPSVGHRRPHHDADHQHQPVAVFFALGSCLLAVAAAWVIAFLFRRHSSDKKGCSRYATL